MLETLRKSVGSWVAKVFIAVLVLSFAVWGIGDVFRGFGQRDLAQVGSARIDVETFRQLYQERLQQLSRQLGRGLTSEQARALGVDRQLLGEILAETTLDERARELRLGLDDESLLTRIHANPAFQGPGGNFDPFRFYEVLRLSGYSEARYLDAERRLVLRRQIGRALSGEIAAPAVLREAEHRYENEERSIEFAVLDRAQAGTIPAPTPEELAFYFEERKAAFRAPEYRKLVVLVLTPETFAAEFPVSDDELRKAYAERRDRFTTPERREIEQIIFPNPEEARAAAQRIAAGATFEDIVAERGLTASDIALGLVTRRDVLDPTVAEAAFALPQGKVSEPIAGRFGSVLVRVLRIEPGRERPFAEVADDLRKELALEHARRNIFDYHDRIEDERAAGLHLAEAAAKLPLKPIVIDAVDRSGRGPDGNRIENIPSFDEVLAGAFATEIGVETDPIEIGAAEGFVWYEVTDITRSRDRTLDEVRDRVEARWRDEQIGKRLTERAEAIRSRLDAGEPFGTVAAGLTVEKRDKLRRGRAVEGFDRNALASVFETAQGRAGIAVAEDGVGRIVFRVVSVNVPAMTSEALETDSLLNIGLQNDILVQYVLHLQDRLGVRVNETAFRTVTGDIEN